MAPTSWTAWSLGFVLLASLALGQGVAGQAVASSAAQKRVLVVHLTPPNSSVSRAADDTYRQRFSTAFAGVDYYSEYVDVYRFADPAYRASLRQYLRDRYASAKLSVVVAPNTMQLRMLRDDGTPLFPGVPIVFHAGVGERADANSTGVVSRVDFAPVLETALRFHPHTRRVLVVTGVSALDANYANLARQQFRRFADHVVLEYLVGQPVKEMERTVSQLSDDTIVCFILYSQSQAGENWLPNEALARITAASSVPVYGIHEQMLGVGIVGGRLFSTQATITATADLAIRVLRGESPADIPVQEISPYITAFDWRQLSRWNISEATLPAGSTVMFRPISIFRSHATTTAIVAVAICAVALLFENRRRRRAEAASHEFLSAAASIERRAVVSHLGDSLAHELQQPLAAIGTNVAALRRLLERGDLSPSALSESLDDIRNSNQRAARIIDHIRSLVRHHPHEEVPIDISALVQDTIQVTAPVARAANVRLDTQLGSRDLVVSGDPVHLQQMLTNLLVNAIHAVSDAESDHRHVVVEVASMPRHVELVVRDRGAGFDDRLLARIFEPSVTTKKDGMGMGLFIVHGIVEAHHGTVTASNDPNGGAVVRILLPRILAGSHNGLAATGVRRSLPSV